VNEWDIAAAVLGAALIPCLAVCLLSPAPHGLLAMEISGVLATTILMLLSAGFARQPFIDLGLVLAVMALVGSLMFARMMERTP
jgi:multisubunit Na+/H+ antiporter MnhF subunit